MREYANLRAQGESRSLGSKLKVHLVTHTMLNPCLEARAPEAAG